MQSKLTLRLEKSLIDGAKTYATEHGKSLSQIVADYFRLLTVQSTPESKKTIELGPLTSSLLGMFSDIELNDYKSLREDYYDYLEAKHS